MFQWVESTIEWFYENFCHSIRRSRKCRYCGKYLHYLDYYVIKDGREMTSFCNSECGCRYVDHYSRNREPFNNYKRNRAKSEDWFD